jgi:hypothetical protein
MAFPKFTKDPDAVLDYGFDWAAWLQTGETISSATWTVPTGITKTTQTENTTETVIWLSGGTAGTNYDVSCRIVTSGGRTDDRTMTIKVSER